MPFAITEIWTPISFEGTRQHRPPEGETLQVRRVPIGKRKTINHRCIFPLGKYLFYLFDCS